MFKKWKYFVECLLRVFCFKTQELARQFKEKVEECQKLSEIQAEADPATETEDSCSAQVSEMIDDSAETLPATDEDGQSPDEKEAEPELSGAAAGDDDEEEDEEPLFSKRATMFYEEESDHSWKVGVLCSLARSESIAIALVCGVTPSSGTPPPPPETALFCSKFSNFSFAANWDGRSESNLRRRRGRLQNSDDQGQWCSHL